MFVLQLSVFKQFIFFSLSFFPITQFIKQLIQPAKLFMFVVFFVTVRQLSFECELQQFGVMQFSTIGAFIEQQLFKLSLIHI